MPPPPPTAGPPPPAPAPVHLLLGSDPFLRREAVAELRAAWERGGPSSFAVHDLAERPLGELLANAASASLFAPRQLLWAQALEALPAKEAAPLLAYVASPRESTLLVCSADKLDRRSKLFQTLAKHAQVRSIAPPEAGALVPWLLARARKAGTPLTPPAAAALVERTGPDLGLLQQSLEKVALSAATPGGAPVAIEPRHVAAAVVRTREASIFALTDALGSGPWHRASRALADLLRGGEEPLIVLAMCIRQVRLLLAAKGPQPLTSVPAFVARGLARQAAALPQPLLCRALADLQACDLALKSSRLAPAMALERALWPLVAAADARGRR